MKISGVSLISSGGLTRRPSATVESGTSKGSFSWALKQAEKSAAAQPGTSSNKLPVDFSNMSRSDLSEWMNAEIKNGQMSLDASFPFLAMTLKVPVSGEAMSLDKTERMNFIEAAREGLAAAHNNSDISTRRMLEQALETMQQQGTRRIVEDSV